jgi:multiple sugar transport system ATP-binding protein
VYDHPANVFVAEFIGSPPMNLLEATRDLGELVVAGGWRLPAPQRGSSIEGADAELIVGLRPEGIQIVADGQSAKVVAVEPFGSEVIIDVRVNGEALKVRAAPNVRPEAGSKVGLRADPAAVRVFDRSSGDALN